jgi:hypothetical protein
MMKAHPKKPLKIVFGSLKGHGPLKEFKMYLAHEYRIRNAKITFCCHAQQIFDKEMSHQN